jgi:hypothetical protein
VEKDHISEIWREVYCPITNEKLSKRQAEVDHYPIGFQELLDRFMKKEGLKYEHVVLYWDKMKMRLRLPAQISQRGGAITTTNMLNYVGSPEKATKFKVTWTMERTSVKLN